MSILPAYIILFFLRIVNLSRPGLLSFRDEGERRSRRAKHASASVLVDPVSRQIMNVWAVDKSFQRGYTESKGANG